ncbi:MAG: hypothetical protein HYU66_21745 [Armatimonadetes bacterium]|nr:hypothetical protein [Armatimonadota bacterium]
MSERTSESRGTISLVLGLLSLFGGGLLGGVPAPFLGIPAWILANQVLAVYPRQHPQYGPAKAGKVMGIISLFLAFGWLVLALLFFMGMVGLGVLGAAAGRM